jgi:hypothetical protein
MSFVPGTIDPNVKIPDAVKANAARAQAAFDAAYSQPVEAAPVDDSATASAEQVVEGFAPPPAEQPAQKQVDDQSWEHRYKSMKGRYDRSEAQIASMSEQIASMQNVIATMQVTRDTYAPPELRAERFITPEEEQDYGPDFLNVVGKKAKEELMPIVSKYEAKISDLEEKLKSVGNHFQQDAKSRMEASLDERLPNWREVNFDPEFISWLKLPDPYSGAIRHELLKGAYQRSDTPRVLAFFNGFLSEEAATDPARVQPDQAVSAQKIPLETFAAPGRAKTAAATGAPAEKPIFTRAQIAQFYAASSAGKYRGREAEKDRIESQIFEAEREGRIR